MSAANAIIKDVRDYLVWTVAARNKLIKKPLGAYYSCFEDFVLREGIEFDHFSPRASKYKRGYPRHCFQNAFNAASRSRGNLSYVEGFAQTERTIIPIHHAWCVDKDGGIVDPTWHGRMNVAPSDYMGVPFPIELVREVRSRESTVIDDWERGWPLMHKKYVS